MEETPTINSIPVTDTNPIPEKIDGGATLSTNQILVQLTVTQIAPANPFRRYIIIRNNGTVVVFVGNAGVSLAGGHTLAVNESLTLETRAAIYGIASAVNAISIIEETL